MRRARAVSVIALALALGVFTTGSNAEEPAARSLGELLELVREGQIDDAREAREREAHFLAERDTQQQQLERVREQLVERQKRSAELEKRFEANEKRIAEHQQGLRTKLGSLVDLLGDLATVASEQRDGFASSLTASEFGMSRVEHTAKLVERAGSGTVLPTIADLESFWYELQREMTAGGEVHAFSAEVVRPDGSRSRMPVVRVGVFNIVSGDGEYLEHEARTGVLVQLPRQPERRFLSAAADLAHATEGMHAFAIDPTGPSGGSFLAALTASPSFGERVQQGGMIGYLIMALGLLGAALALQRFVVLGRMHRRVEAQRSIAAPSLDNPLGRVLAACEADAALDVEALELRVSEAVIRELPVIERGLSLLRIIATVAPLLGLLGTVTGMIVTFQSITIFGAGDPKAMAGGISQALVTTVQGLCVAIPIVFAHALLGARARGITRVLEEETTGLLAARTSAGAAEQP